MAILFIFCVITKKLKLYLIIIYFQFSTLHLFIYFMLNSDTFWKIAVTENKKLT